jgi:hypothetical protein
MKKVLLAVSLCLSLAVVASAKGMFVGGSLGYNQPYHEVAIGGETSSFNVTPEFGIDLNKKWSVGIDFGYGRTFYNNANGDLESLHEENVTSLSIAPFAEYTAATFGKFALKFKGSIGYANETYKFKGKNDTETEDYFAIAVKPVVYYSLSKSFSLFVDLNFLKASYVNTSKDNTSGLNFNLDANDVLNNSYETPWQIGLVYNF